MIPLMTGAAGPAAAAAGMPDLSSSAESGSDGFFKGGGFDSGGDFIVGGTGRTQTGLGGDLSRAILISAVAGIIALVVVKKF